ISFCSPPLHARGIAKECGVCGDVAKSMHFGGLSCDSCKAFFRRSVQNNAYKGFSCPYEKKCVIGVSSRKACQYCRFEKCISIGMEKGWVMSEEERKKMMEQRKERKMKQNVETSQKQHDNSLYSLSEEDRSEIARIVSLYKKAYNTIPYDEASAETGNGQGNSGSFVLGPWMTFCKRIAYFFSLFRDFAELSPSDQALLLRTALTSAGIIMGSVVYDSSNGKWAAKVNRSRTGNLSITTQSVEKLVPSDLITRVDKFFKKFQQICPDETMAMILILVSLYSPELMGLEARDRVQHLQERYIHILQNYVKYKFKEKSSVMFPKAIVSLADIRELADRTGQMRIHDKSASLFSGFSSMMQQGGAPLGSPYSGLSLSSNIPPQPPAPEEAGAVCLSGPKNDPIYQRIMKVIYQIHGSTLNAKSPTLLPLVIQILKKWAHAKQEGRSGRALAGPTRRTHRHSRPKTSHRSSSHRSRRLGIKGEPPMEEDFPLTIKEEIMDHSEDTLMQLNQETTHTPVSGGHFGTTMSSQELMETFPQIQQQHFQQQPVGVCQQQQQQQQHHHQQQQQNSSLLSTRNDNPNAPLYNTVSDIASPSSDVQYVSPHSQSPFRTEGSPLAYPHAVSPDESFHTISPRHPMVHSPQQQAMVHSPQQQSMAHSPQQQAMVHSPQQYPMCHSPQQQTTQQTMVSSPQQLSVRPHIQVTEPHMPPMSPFPPPHQQISPSTAAMNTTGNSPNAGYQHESSCYSSLGPSPSPYSSSSSSSSPEDVDASQSDLFQRRLIKD
ncbi:Thyroid hormone receptor beta-A, partial [Armadillidium nasatum]